jgi:hypothetical protein
MQNDYLRYPGDNVDVDIYCYDKDELPLNVGALDAIICKVYQNGRVIDTISKDDEEVTIDENKLTIELSHVLSLTLKRGPVYFLVTLVAPEALFIGNLHYQTKQFKVADIQLVAA